MRYRFETLDALVVDDSEQMRNYLVSVLEIFRVRRVRTAAGGSEAMRMTVREPPDLVITDLQMSPVDGVALVRWLRDDPDSPDRFVPAIMVTASTRAPELAQARSAGLHRILPKPVAPQALGDAILEILGDPLPFIRTRAYFGPERRRGNGRAPGRERRVPAARQQGPRE